MSLGDGRSPVTSEQVRNGIKIRTYVPPGQPFGTVIYTHGYSEHSMRYDSLARYLCMLNWACVTYDVRGHGESEGVRGWISSFKLYMDDLEQVQAVAEAIETKTGNLVFVSHSNGGLITLSYLSNPKRAMNPKIKACILSAPFLSTATPLKWVEKVLVRIVGTIKPQMQAPFEPGFEQHLTHDTAMHATRREDKMCFNNSTLGWFYQARVAQKRLSTNLSGIQVPTYWFVPGQDLVCSPQKMREAAKKLQEMGRKAEVFEFPDFYHEVFLEKDRDRPLSALQSILAKL